MLRITNKSHLILDFLSNLMQPKILRVIFSDLIKNRLVIQYIRKLTCTNWLAKGMQEANNLLVRG